MSSMKNSSSIGICKCIGGEKYVNMSASEAFQDLFNSIYSADTGATFPKNAEEGTNVGWELFR